MKRFRDMSLGSTINVIVFPCVIVLSALISLNNMISLRKAMVKEFDARITVMGESLSWSSADQLSALEAFSDIALMRSMSTSLQTTLQSIVKQEDIEYAAIILPDEELLVGTGKESGKEFTPVQGNIAGQRLAGRYEVRTADSLGKYGKEVRFPINKENAFVGTLVFGYSEASIHKQLRKTVYGSMLTGFAGSLLLSLLIAVIMRRLISVPVQDAAAILEKMARNDFSDYMMKDYTGEHDIIKNSINGVLATLNDSLKKVAESTSRVSATSEDLSRTAGEMAAEAEEQMTQTTLVANSMEKMAATIQDIAKHSNSAVDRAKEAGATAMTGGRIVEATVNGMRRIEQSVKELQAVIGGLSTNSEKIGDIIGVIDDVADQTNLLALNAAIEAARAGEQGRGFAVVADEVRKLAERTSASTKEIVLMVQSIQGDTKKAVASMETSVRDVQSGLSSAEQAGRALGDIVVNAGKVQDMVLQIAMAADQQAAATTNILANVEAISSASKQNASGAQQTSKASQGLNQITGDLKRIVESFRLNG